MKFFNTAGSVNQEEHYKIDPLHGRIINTLNIKVPFSVNGIISTN